MLVDVSGWEVCRNCKNILLKEARVSVNDGANFWQLAAKGISGLSGLCIRITESGGCFGGNSDAFAGTISARRTSSSVKNHTVIAIKSPKEEDVPI